MSIDAIKLINQYDIPCVVLTKSTLPAELAELSDINQYDVALVSLDEYSARRWSLAPRRWLIVLLR